MIYYTKKIEDQVVLIGHKWQDLFTEAAKHHRSRITVESYSEAKEWSEQQRKWWKGILLRKLSEDNGDSILCWENRLKKEVMPDDFPTIVEEIEGETYRSLPSITTLGIKKMNEMVEGSVAYLRDKGFLWITLPDKELRR